MNSIFDAVTKDARTNVVLLYNQIPGIIIAACAGTLSTISSITIMFLIVFRSRDALDRVYHRIMFGMSAADVLMSTAIAVTTLAMPRDSIYGQFEGLMLGNQATCNIQGFLFTFGGLCTSMYNASLMVYFYLSIHNRMSDANISRCIEPFLHIASVGYGLVLGIAFLVFELYNPTPFVPWCTIIMYPWWCTGPGGTDESHIAKNCLLRGNEKGIPPLRGVLGISFIFILVVVLYSLINIVWTIYSQEKLLLFSVRQTNYYIAANNIIAQDLRYTKVIFRQSLLYVCAYLLVNIFPVISLFGSSLRLQPWFQVTQLSLRPLQGFFNLIIFLNHKVYNARRRSSNLSIYDALRKVFASKGEPEHIISTLMLVRNYQEINEEFLSIQVVDLIDGKILDFDDNIGNRGNQKDGVGSDHSDNLSPPFGGSRSSAGGSNDLSGFDDAFSDHEGISSYSSSHLSSQHKSQDGASRPSRDDSKLSNEISTDE